MKKFFRLLGMQLGLRFGLIQTRYFWHHDKKRFIRNALLGLLILVGVASIAGTYGFLVWALFDAVRGVMDLQRVLLSLVMTLTPLVTLLTGVLTVLSVLYFSKDTAFLASLPLSQRAVFAAKFSQVLLLEYLFSTALLLPPMLFYAGATGWDYALRCLLVLLCTPLLPLLLSAVLCMLLMRFTVLWRHRDTVLTMASLALLLGYFVGQAMLSNRIPKDFDASFLTAYLLGRRSMVDALTAWYPPARWAADALTLGGDAVWRSLGLLVGVSLLGLAVTLGMAQRAYYASALAMGEQAKARTRVRRRSLRVGGAQSPALAIYLREWRMVLRTPTYAINSLSSIFMTPLIVSMPTMFSSGQWDRAQLLGFLHSQVPVPLLILITTGIIGFFSAINPAAGTVISREGTNFWLAQTVPIPGRTQVLIKYGFGASISIPAVALAALCLPLSLGIAWPVAAGVFALCALMCLHINAVAVLIDLARPNFRWENPAQIIKQSLNAMLSMLYGLVLMLVLAALLWGGYALGLSWGAMAWGVGGVLAALGAASTALLLRKSEALFAKLCR